MELNDKQKAFKEEHEIFSSFCWHIITSIPSNVEMVKTVFGREKLICHIMLGNELFYIWEDELAQRTLNDVQAVYPEVTLDELKEVYDKYKELVWSIYG